MVSQNEPTPLGSRGLYVSFPGIAADYTDSMNGITEKLPWLLLWVFVSTMILLFLFTGSILLPLKAFLLNVVTLAATLGFLCWVFLDGNMRDPGSRLDADIAAKASGAAVLRACASTKPATPKTIATRARARRGGSFTPRARKDIAPE